MAAGHGLLGIVCAVVIGGSGLPGSGVVGYGKGSGAVISAAQGEIGVREVGQNAGKRVREYLEYTGIKVPAPYCASFVSWCFAQAGYSQPRTAWCPALFPGERSFSPSLVFDHLPPKGARESLMPGLVFGIWFPSMGRIGHVGLVERLQGDYVVGIEGNTSPDGSRDGVGVFRRMRHKRTIYKYSNWL